MNKSNVKIYGKSVFKIISIINKLQLKDFLGKIYNEYIEAEKKDRVTKVKLIKELEKKKLENNTDNIALVLEKNKSLAAEIAENNKINAELMQEVIFTILEKIGYAEVEIYELLADVYKKEVKEIAEETEIDELITMIEGVIKADGFIKVFSHFFK